MPWIPEPELPGCVGAIAARDNHGVEAVLVAYQVSDAGLILPPSDLPRLWEPPQEMQDARLARFDFAERGVGEELTNNRTLHYMAAARDLAGNVQPRNLRVRRSLFDDQGPFVDVLNRTIDEDHDSITYKWFAKDLEAGGKVVRSYVQWGRVEDPGLVALLRVFVRAYPGQGRGHGHEVDGAPHRRPPA
jgi:hypothetical protein